MPDQDSGSKALPHGISCAVTIRIEFVSGSLGNQSISMESKDQTRVSGSLWIGSHDRRWITTHADC